METLIKTDIKQDEVCHLLLIAQNKHLLKDEFLRLVDELSGKELYSYEDDVNGTIKVCNSPDKRAIAEEIIYKLKQYRSDYKAGLYVLEKQHQSTSKNLVSNLMVEDLERYSFIIEQLEEFTRDINGVKEYQKRGRKTIKVSFKKQVNEEDLRIFVHDYLSTKGNSKTVLGHIMLAFVKMEILLACPSISNLLMWYGETPAGKDANYNRVIRNGAKYYDREINEIIMRFHET